MSDVVDIYNYTVVFNCISCGQLLSVNSRMMMNAECYNCGARYDTNGGEKLYRYAEGRPPTQWVNNGYEPATERST